MLFSFEKERNGNAGNICFIDASKDFETGKSQNYITDEHIEKIVTAYKNRINIDKYCYVATLKEIEENNYNLNIPRYVDSFEKEIEINIPSLQKQLMQHKEESKILDDKINSYLIELGLGEV